MDLTGSVYPEKPVVPFIKATRIRHHVQKDIARMHFTVLRAGRFYRAKPGKVS